MWLQKVSIEIYQINKKKHNIATCNSTQSTEYGKYGAKQHSGEQARNGIKQHGVINGEHNAIHGRGMIGKAKKGRNGAEQEHNKAS